MTDHRRIGRCKHGPIGPDGCAICEEEQEKEVEEMTLRAYAQEESIKDLMELVLSEVTRRYGLDGRMEIYVHTRGMPECYIQARYISQCILRDNGYDPQLLNGDGFKWVTNSDGRKKMTFFLPVEEVSHSEDHEQAASPTSICGNGNPGLSI